METIDAVNEAQLLLIKAVSGNLDPKEITLGLFTTLTDAALNWAMVEEAMKAKTKDEIKNGDYRWVRPKWRTRWEVAEFRHDSNVGMMCFMLDGMEFVDDKFMKEWVIGGRIVLPPDAVIK